MALLLSPAAHAEDVTEAMLSQVGFDEVEALALELDGFDAREVLEKALSGELPIDADAPKRALRHLAREVKRGLTEALSLLAAPVLATLLLRLALGRKDGALALLCRLACAAALMARCAGIAGAAAEALSNAKRVADVLSPVLTAALALAGSSAASAMLTPLSALCAGAIEGLLLRLGVPLCVLAAAIVCAGNLSDSFRLDRLFALAKRCAGWLVGGCVAAFVGLLAVEGRLAAAQDLGAVRAVSQALKSLIPVIGGNVSDAAGMLADSAFAVKNALGVTGLALALASCAAPALRLVVYALSVQLAAAAVEPVADPCIARIASGFGDVAKLLLALCVGGYLMVALMAGACLGGVPVR